MAENNKKVRNNSWQYWTNERHVHFLNSMEASFVRSMFFQNQNNNNAAATRLDRYLPDTSDSTEDLPRERSRRRRHSTSDIVESSSGTRTEKKTFKNLSSSHKSSQDQVVPQFHEKRDDKDEHEKGHHLDVSHG